MKTKNENTNAKQFATVQEWLSSKPSTEEIQKVLDLVNKSVKKGLRIELYKKEAELKKTLRFVDQMKALGFKGSDEVKSKVALLETEVNELKNQLPEPVKRIKKEKTLTETKTE